MRHANLAGAKFGLLSVVAPAFTRGGGRYSYRWKCLCECGTAKLVESSHLKSGAVISCGCSKRSRSGASSHPLYNVWRNMVRRCQSPGDKQFKDYGGRGVFVCSRWMSPENFFADMGPRPEGTTLERIDNSGPYSPENCRWATRHEQASNKRNVPLYSFGGELLSVAQLARLHGLHPETLRSRLKSGVPLKQALSTTRRRSGPSPGAHK